MWVSKIFFTRPFPFRDSIVQHHFVVVLATATIITARIFCSKLFVGVDLLFFVCFVLFHSVAVSLQFTSSFLLMVFA